MRATIRALPLTMLLAALAVPEAHAATFRVGSGRGCMHEDVQDAVDAAASHPGFDVIFVTRTLEYTKQAIRIRDQEVALIGGFPNCVVDANDAQKTVLSGAGGEPASVVSISGKSWVMLVMLEIQNGDVANLGLDFESLGGGIHIWGRSEVGLENVIVANNRAHHGGGIALGKLVEAGISPDSGASILRIGAGTYINFNDGGYAGGGVYCVGDSTIKEDSRIEMVQSPSVIFGNKAWNGGGIAARNCKVDIASGGLLFPAVSGNSAIDNGGGIDAVGPRTEVRLFTREPDQPVRIHGNFADETGGGIRVANGAVVNAWHAIVDRNEAEHGGGVYVGRSAPGPRAHFALLPPERDPPRGARPAGAVACSEKLGCNRIADNRAGWDDMSASALQVDRGDALLDSALVFGNAGGVVLRAATESKEPERTELELRNVLVANNAEIGSSVLHVGADTRVLIDGSTLASRRRSTASTLVRVETWSELLVERSILYAAPGVGVLRSDAPLPQGAFRYVMASEVASLPAGTGVVADDPRFVDPSILNYRLAPDSPALDFAPIHDPWPFDLDRRDRVRDLPEITNLYGARDLGAYER